MVQVKMLIRWLAFNGTNSYSSVAKIEKVADKTYPLAQTQVHGFTESRPVIYETNLKSFTANPAKLY